MLPQLLIFALFALVSAQNSEKGFQCYNGTGLETAFCPSGYCFGGIDCSVFAGTTSFYFFGKCVQSKREGQRICKDFGCTNCTNCQGNKCNDEFLLRGVNTENNEKKNFGRSKIIMTMPSTSTESITSTSSMPPSTPSGAISAFSNGPKWESSIYVAILTASALLLTVAIF